MANQYKYEHRKKQGELEMLERQVSRWLGKKKIPLLRFRKLKPHNQVLLRDLLCRRTSHRSPAQLTGLWNDLGLTDARGSSSDQVGYPTYEELIAFFAPQTPSEELPYLYRF